MSVLQDMAAKLRQCRQYLGFTQQEIADKLNLHREAIAEIEAGRRKVTAEEFHALARVYQKPIDYFLGEEPPEPNQELLALASTLNETDKAELLKFGEFLRWRKQTL